MRGLVNTIAIQLYESTVSELQAELIRSPKIGTRKGENKRGEKADTSKLVHAPGYGMVTPKQYDDLVKRGVIQESKNLDVKMTMPLFIRLLEWAKEDCKDDVQIHQVAEKISAIDCADMDDYEDLLK
jgi:hypothetical protein